MPIHKIPQTKYFYCTFCRKEVEPNIVRLRGRGWGEYHTSKPKLVLCPTCGGIVEIQARARVESPRAAGCPIMGGKYHAH